MIGELFNAMVDEVAGNDPENRNIGALPYIFGKCAAYSQAPAQMNMAPALKPPGF